MFKKAQHKVTVSTNKYPGVLTMQVNENAARKEIFVFHSVGKDFFSAAISADEGNFRRRHYLFSHAELLSKYELML